VKDVGEVAGFMHTSLSAFLAALSTKQIQVAVFFGSELEIL
jgi:hypothetical protein